MWDVGMWGQVFFLVIYNRTFIGSPEKADHFL